MPNDRIGLLVSNRLSNSSLNIARSPGCGGRIHQIAEELKIAYPANMTMRISPEAIYAYIYVLPRGALKKRTARLFASKSQTAVKTGAGVQVERKIEDMLSIEERPAEVAERIVPGHWEGDLIVGKKNRSALGTLVERTTRTVIQIAKRPRWWLNQAFPPKELISTKYPDMRLRRCKIC